VSASLKHDGDPRRGAVAATTLPMIELESRMVVEPKNLSLAVPNMLHADYGSRMTSSIYVRGLGSRMEHPAMGLYVDGVPILNNNNYDFDYFDVRRIDVLRGPQGTLYGRNTIGGVIDVQTLSPFDYQGARLGAGYGNGNSWSAQAAVYRRPTAGFGYSVAASYRATDGFFVNEYDGSAADSGQSGSVRVKIQALTGGGWTMENSLTVGLVKQGGFAYAPYDEMNAASEKIDHNDPCGYYRLGLTDGLTFRRDDGRVRLSSTTSYQFTRDEMTLDQDFSPASIFTLRQSQLEHALTEEFVVRSQPHKKWQWIAGFFGFWRGMSSRAPVTFKRDGIETLILDNANEGIDNGFPPADYPDADLEIRQQQFPIRSDFRLPSFGASLYHQSSLRAGRWNFTAGLRADWEYTAIRYANSAEIDYRFTLTMPEFKPLPVTLDGRREKTFLELMPRADVVFETGVGNLYASVSRGYKAGGYNTQIFSDILQNRMMNAVMEDLGVYFDATGGRGAAYATEGAISDAISYDPERSWNYELGGHFDLIGGRLRLDAALFYIDCRDQQLTVFPPGEGTGRLMSNAGRTRSLGAELSADLRLGEFRLSGAYGHTDARFVVYNDGRADYAGKYVPYAPRNTVSVRVEYGVDFRDAKAGRLVFSAGAQGAGAIYWDESNSVRQPFYTLLDASVAWKTDRHAVSVWARNIAGTDYNTVYFKSMGRSFVQRGKPLQAGITLIVTL
jgi:outer membrane receptor protein involved in Fe transport